MIEKLNNNEGVKRSQTTAGQRELIREMRNKINELVESVNDHEDMIYGCGCDDDLDEDENGNGGRDCCPACCDWDDDEEVTEYIKRTVDDVRGKNQPRVIDTTDGLFSDFTAFVAAHPGLRFWQAATAWGGYKKLYGEDKDGELTDLFYKKTTKGPRA